MVPAIMRGETLNCHCLVQVRLNCSHHQIFMRGTSIKLSLDTGRKSTNIPLHRFIQQNVHRPIVMLGVFTFIAAAVATIYILLQLA